MTVQTGMKSINEELLNSLADDLRGPVALHLRQKLLPVEGENGVIFPPTYAMSDDRKFGPYAIDQLSDGTKVAQIDSVGSQANRMEPLFKRAPDGRPENPFAKLVPQIEIVVSDDKSVSLFDIGHRIGDALLRASGLREDVRKAFSEFQKNGDATPIAKLAPTSIVFGAWDSRGEGAKLPRIVQSVVRAWEVEVLRRSAQYNPPVDYSKFDVFSEEEKQKAEGDTGSPLAQRGFVHVPAVDTHGGVVVRGSVFRDVTVNLVALRQLDGKPNGVALRRYILGLALIAATDPQDGFLRQGCLLTPDPEAAANWILVHRSGVREQLEVAEGTVLAYAETAAKEFGVGPNREEQFSKEAAKADLPDKKEKAPKKPKG
jgi:CRISPR-associated protein Csb1